MQFHTLHELQVLDCTHLYGFSRFVRLTADSTQRSAFSNCPSATHQSQILRTSTSAVTASSSPHSAIRFQLDSWWPKRRLIDVGMRQKCCRPRETGHQQWHTALFKWRLAVPFCLIRAIRFRNLGSKKAVKFLGFLKTFLFLSFAPCQNRFRLCSLSSVTHKYYNSLLLPGVLERSQQSKYWRDFQ